ncbi:nucleolin 2 [Galendromus occidentalis]|uniref:Nucleolin 2 n=1 Tax=Galendromus occidentalis TaxID=34638 RepID=A0AAJ6QQK3_9ACAR|nr:nucleolin 2 [Galendromus occidentalis]
MSSSSSALSSSGEEEAPPPRRTRSSTSRQAPIKRRSRTPTKRVVYSPESSSDEEIAPAKRRRNPPRSPQKAANDSDPASTERNTRNARKRRSVSFVNSPQKDDQGNGAEAESDSDTPTPRESSPLREQQKTRTPQTSVGSPRMNGTVRTPRAKADIILEENFVHALKMNTAMMGDLAAELRLLREAVVSQNRMRST